MKQIQTYAYGLFVTAVVATGCAKLPDIAADEASIRKTDSDMVAALNARDVDRWLTFFASDAKMMPPGAPPVAGKEAIRKLIAELMTIPNFAVAHHLESVVVSRSGDLAYVSYSFELTVKDAKGQPVTERGKDISVYKKESDGSWKLAVDMWSENQPPSAPS